MPGSTRSEYTPRSVPKTRRTALQYRATTQMRTGRAPRRMRGPASWRYRWRRRASAVEMRDKGPILDELRLRTADAERAPDSTTGISDSFAERKTPSDQRDRMRHARVTTGW